MVTYWWARLSTLIMVTRPTRGLLGSTHFPSPENTFMRLIEKFIGNYQHTMVGTGGPFQRQLMVLSYNYIARKVSAM